MAKHFAHLGKAVLFASVVFGGLLAGCGGEAAAVSPGSYSGVYTGSFTRGDGSIMAVISSGGGINVSVVDDTGRADPDFYTGSGSVESDGSVSIELSRSTQRIRLDGVFQTLGSSTPYFEGNIVNLSGGFNLVGIGLSRTTQNTQSPFTGSFSGSYRLPLLNRTQGSLTYSVDSSGVLTGTAVDVEGGTFNVSGTVSSVGILSFSGQSTGGITTTFTGGHFINSSEIAMAAGRWTSGDWPNGGTLTATKN